MCNLNENIFALCNERGITKMWRKAPAFRHGDISRVLFKEVVQWNILTSFDCTRPRRRSGKYSGRSGVVGSIYRNCIYCHIKILTILVPHCIISMR